MNKLRSWKKSSIPPCSTTAPLVGSRKNQPHPQPAEVTPIGATFYFAREALIDALLTGLTRFSFLPVRHRPMSSNSTSRLCQRSGGGAERRSDGASQRAILYFLGTNARTAQSYHGNRIWMNISGYRNSRSCAKWLPYGYSQKMATNLFFHAIQPDTSAYPFWSGALFNRGRNKADRCTSTCPTAIWPPACCAQTGIPPDSHRGRCSARRM